MALILIMITNQIRYIRIDKRIGYKIINKSYNKKIVIKEKYKEYQPESHTSLEIKDNTSYHIMIE